MNWLRQQVWGNLHYIFGDVLNEYIKHLEQGLGHGLSAAVVIVIIFMVVKVEELNSDLPKSHFPSPSSLTK